MARVIALIPDLLFASRVQSSLAGAGHEVELIADPARVERSLAAGAGDRGRRSMRASSRQTWEVLVVDLTQPDLDGAALVEELSARSALAHTRVLGFYSHVDTTMRERAERAGFDLVVPRSRMAREGAELAARLAGDDGSPAASRPPDNPAG
jgi:CheY-like chemotaxis protein